MSDLEFWRATLRDQVAQLVELMATDARECVERSVREAFVAHPEADVAASTAKRTASEHGEAAAAALRAQLSAVAWAELPWEGETAPEDVPPLAEAARALQAASEAALRASGLPLPADGISYTLPRRFINGANLVSLVRGVARAAQSLRRRTDAAETEARVTDRAARRQAWDDA